MYIELLKLVLGLVVLGLAAHYLVGAAVRLARKLGMSELLVGLTIIAAGTSAPEIAVSVMAALNGQGALSVGNVIGSNIFNLGVILGLVALIVPQKIAKKMVYRDGLVLVASTVLVLFCMFDQYISRGEGIVLLLGLVAYTTYLWIRKDAPEDVEEEVKAKPFPLVVDLGILVATLAVLIGSSHIVLDAAVLLARTAGLSEWTIGVTIVAVGTSLPELATSIMASLRGRHGISVGNLIGSDIFNVFGIIGVSALVMPLVLTSTNTIFTLPDNLFSVVVLILTILLVLFFMRTGWRLSRVEGGILLGISVARIVFELVAH